MFVYTSWCMYLTFGSVCIYNCLLLVSVCIYTRFGVCMYFEMKYIPYVCFLSVCIDKLHSLSPSNFNRVINFSRDNDLPSPFLTLLKKPTTPCLSYVSFSHSLFLHTPSLILLLHNITVSLSISPVTLSSHSTSFH